MISTKMRETFRKKERLCSKNSIDLLFSSGKDFFVYPFKIKWIEASLNYGYPAEIMIVVPKRYSKKSVKRNKIKRFIKEAYRKRKYLLYKQLETSKKKIFIALLYIGKEFHDYEFIKEKINIILHRLIIEVENADTN